MDGPAARRLLSGYVLVAADEAYGWRLWLAADRELQGELFECRGALLVALPGRDREHGTAVLIFEIRIEHQPAIDVLLEFVEQLARLRRQLRLDASRRERLSGRVIGHHRARQLIERYLVGAPLALDRHPLERQFARRRLLDAVVRQTGVGQEADHDQPYGKADQRNLAILELAARITIDVG